MSHGRDPQDMVTNQRVDEGTLVFIEQVCPEVSSLKIGAGHPADESALWTAYGDVIRHGRILTDEEREQLEGKGS